MRVEVTRLSTYAAEWITVLNIDPSYKLTISANSRSLRRVVIYLQSVFLARIKCSGESMKTLTPHGRSSSNERSLGALIKLHAPRWN